MWCIPPARDAAFVRQMEQVLGVYKRPYDPRRPVVCMDEQPRQLISETRRPVPAAPGRPERVDYEYVREGTCTIWMFVEPLGGWRDVRVTETKTAVDRAEQVRLLVDDPRYAEAERITLACDDLNTHGLASLYKAFEPAEALRIARRLELVHTPKHGSWSNVAESELSVLTRQCLGRRIATLREVVEQATAWGVRRDRKQVGVDWQFTTEDARIKLKHLYPKIRE
jgi:DDE superfamily endonuclease